MVGNESVVAIGKKEITRCLSSECSFCRDNCPAYTSFRLDTYSSRGKNRVISAASKKKFAKEEIVDVAFSCTLCGQCEEVCLTDGSFYSYAKEMRRELNDKDFTPDNIKELVEKIKKTGTPFKKKDDSWTAETKFSRGKTAYFPGCTMQAHTPELAAKTVELLEEIGIETVPLSRPCCGSPVFRSGFFKEAKEIAVKFNAELKERNISKIITSCPGCASMLGNEYPKLTGERLNVKHITQVLSKNLRQLKKINKPKKLHNTEKIAFHDPCHLARELSITAEPRRILKAMGLNIEEFANHGRETACCGGGGGFAKNYPKKAIFAAKKRADEADELEVDTIVTSCPLCQRMLSKACTGKIHVKDIVDVI